MSYKDKEKNREYNKRWRLEHCEQKRQYDKQWRLEHPEYKKQWKENNPEKWKEIRKRKKFKREHNLGFIPLNEFFEGSEAHHIDGIYVIHIPEDIHKSIRHSVLKNINMDEINAIAFNYLGPL
jgi:hypothetical protein